MGLTAEFVSCAVTTGFQDWFSIEGQARRKGLGWALESGYPVWETFSSEGTDVSGKRSRGGHRLGRDLRQPGQGLRWTQG